MNEDIDVAILNLLSDESKCWTWYNLDRAITRAGYVEHGSIASIAEALAESGMIEQRSGRSPGMPIYTLTDKGRSLLARRR